MVKKASKKAKEVRSQIEKWRSYFSRNIQKYHYMMNFVWGSQWTDDERHAMLKTFKKVALQSNKLAAMANSLLGEQQQNTPQLEVNPLTDCSEETASLREAIVKDTALSTDRRTVYQVAAGQAFVGGFGAFGWAPRYTHSHSFEQEPYAFYLNDATKAYFDRGAEDINKIDGMFAGYVSYMSRLKFRATYGEKVENKILNEKSSIPIDSEGVIFATERGAENESLVWSDKDAIAIINHFERKGKKEILYKLSNGQSYNQQEMDEIFERSIKIAAEQQFTEMGADLGIEQSADQMQGEIPPEELNQLMMQADEATPQPDTSAVTLYVAGEPVSIVGEKEITVYSVKHYQIAGEYILDETDFPSEHLPMIFVDYNSWFSEEGKQYTRSFFDDAVDIQRYINYLRTQSAHILKISRYDQFIGSKKNVSSNDTRQIWTDPSNQQGLLAFDESPSGIVPQQLTPPELSQSLHTQYQLAIEDLYTSTGLYPTRMGEQGNEVSGAAIDARTRQGSYSTYTAFNSINRAIAAGGKVLNEMIPHLYDTERTISLMIPNKGRQMITINQQMDEYGELIANDIRKGTFEVVLRPGPSYEGQKQEALTSLKEVLQANPQVFNMVADLYAQNLPLSNTLELVNRFKTLVPPEILEAGKTGETPPQDNKPSPEEQMAQMQAQFQQAQLQIKMQELQLKEQELAMKLQMQEFDNEIKREEMETKRLEVAAELEEVKLRYLAETDRTQSDHAIAHADNMTKILTHLK